MRQRIENLAQPRQQNLNRNFPMCHLGEHIAARFRLYPEVVLAGVLEPIAKRQPFGTVQGRSWGTNHSWRGFAFLSEAWHTSPATRHGVSAPPIRAKTNSTS